MKKLLLNTFGILAVFCTLLAFSSTASAAEKTIAIIAQGATYSGNAEKMYANNVPVKEGNVTMSVSSYNSTSKEFRSNASTELKITPVEGVTLKRIFFTNTNKVSGSTGTSSDKATSYDNTTGKCEWTGSSTKAVIITHAKQFRFKYIEITFEKAEAGNPGNITPELTWNVKEVTAVLGDQSFVAPTLTCGPTENAADVKNRTKYKSSDPKVATIDDNGELTLVGRGTTTITAYVDEGEGYNAQEASYTLSVIDLDQYVLTFGSTGNSKGVSNYTSTWTRTCDGKEWTISNFNNNNNDKSWTFIRCGSKNEASVGTITTAFVIAYPVNEIDLRIDNMNVPYVNSVKLLTSTSATDFENPVHSIEIEKSLGVKVINIPNPQANLYYRLEFDCEKASKNGVVQVGEVVYKLKKDNKESAELAYATTTVNKATTDQPFINPLTNEHGVKVVYSSDNAAVATVDAETGEVTVVGVGQAVISAAFAGNETYSKQTVSYTLNVALGVNSIEETLALEDKTEVLINYPMTVAFRNGKNVFAVDEAGKFIQIYGSNSYAANDIIPAGWTGKFTLYSGATPEITPVGALPEAVAGGSFVPAVVDPTTVTVDMVNSVVLLKNAVIDAATPTGKDNFDATIAGNTVNLRTNYMSTSASAGVYDITAVVNLYNNAVSLYAAGYKAVPAFRINGELVTETTFDANGLKIKLEAVLPEGHQMWYRFTPVEAASTQAVTDEDGFTKYESAFELEDPGKLEYYSVDPDNNKSEVYELRLDNVTGINDIVVDGDNSEAVYYNLQGVRVDNPNTGIYLVRRAGRVSKVFVK